MSSHILAIDACTEACSVALMSGESTLSRFEVCPQQHSQRLLPMVDEILAEAQLSLQQLDALVFGRGPGSFTGVRIGVSIAQGLAFGADIGVYGVSTLETLAAGGNRLHGSRQVFAAIDARMDEIYYGLYQQDEGLMTLQGEEGVVKPSALMVDGLAQFATDELLGVGTGWQTYADVLKAKVQAEPSAEVLFPNAVDMLARGKWALQQGKLVAAEEAQPVYVRDTVTWQKLPGRQ